MEWNDPVERVAIGCVELMLKTTAVLRLQIVDANET